MKKVSFDDRGMKDWIKSDEIEAYTEAVSGAEAMLEKGTGPGNGFLGWLHLPQKTGEKELKRIKETADEIREKAGILVCIGIGGSYLGARAAIEFLSPAFDEQRKPRVLFAGHHVNSDYMSDMLKILEGRDVAINVVSKSGTTTEPGISFRVLRKWMEARYGKKESAKRIIATTDPKEGALRKLAEDEGYLTLPIPPDVGGRFSVLTPVGLFPISFSGIDISKLMQGAGEALSFCSGNDLDKNQSARYAVVRNLLFRRGKTVEVLASFQPQIHFVSEWWKQLAGESEGKNLTGIFPAAVDYTTDLHSLGQWMQEGTRNVFETFIALNRTAAKIEVPSFDDNLDGLNYLAGKSFEEINRNAFQGTVLAHLDGGVPISNISLEDRSEATLGQLFYFFEKAIALSGYILRVNPFDQPGVEEYKKNMFGLLEKPGHEKRGQELKQRIERFGL